MDASIDTDTFIKDLKVIILEQELRPIANDIVISYSTKSFSEEDIMKLFEKHLSTDEDIKTDKLPIEIHHKNASVSDKSDNHIKPEPEPEPELTMSLQVPEHEPEHEPGHEPEHVPTPVKVKKVVKKRLRKNKVSGLNVFKKKNKAMINKEYNIQRLQNSSLKIATVSGELWGKTDQSLYTKIADEINLANDKIANDSLKNGILVNDSTNVSEISNINL